MGLSPGWDGSVRAQIVVFSTQIDVSSLFLSVSLSLSLKSNENIFNGLETHKGL